MTHWYKVQIVGDPPEILLAQFVGQTIEDTEALMGWLEHLRWVPRATVWKCLITKQ